MFDYHENTKMRLARTICWRRIRAEISDIESEVESFWFLNKSLIFAPVIWHLTCGCAGKGGP